MFKRLLSTLTLALIGSGALHAQESPASQTFKQQLRGKYLQNDTAQAIISLYSTRQAGGAGWIVGSALAAARIATAPTRTTVNGMVVREESNAGLAFVFALPFAGYGVGKLLHYSNGNLEEVLTNYAAGKPLPRSLKRKLKRRFFAKPIVQYTPVPATPTN
jgi:hypothetical protein